MRVEIRKNGVLSVSAETEIESFALGVWINSNLIESDVDGQTIIGNGKISFDWGFCHEKHKNT